MEADGSTARPGPTTDLAPPLALDVAVSPSKVKAPVAVAGDEGLAGVPPKEVGYERDNDAPAQVDMAELTALLLPGGCLPACADKFSLQYSLAAFKGWVKQRSPACAAASVAGSWNTLMGLERGSDGALDQDAVVEVFANNLRATIAKKRER